MQSFEVCLVFSTIVWKNLLENSGVFFHISLLVTIPNCKMQINVSTSKHFKDSLHCQSVFFCLFNLHCRVFHLLIPCTSAFGTMTELNRNSVGRASVISLKDLDCILLYASIFWCFPVSPSQ